MEIQSPHGGKGHELSSLDLKKALREDQGVVNHVKEDESQPDVLTRLGKFPILKVSSSLSSKFARS